eukprot:CAMPEP_0178612302 /NCGR_PEP_ID=MMETSP0698-20121128/1057_1 /TAXON_ID=265572 /ORGANISM="Extubocellulus spinifer, Strain CCMP396" /LENGTH=543 /DNA_ID=CAMNT_0020250959 /DNA_START=364 /DNA_END=1995 /DNA_ORIENTATION=+
MQDIPPDEEGIADGSPLRQLMPYHDLSSASETYIKRRRQKLLEIRKRRLGVDYDFEEEESHGIFCQGILQRGAVSDDVPPTRAQEGIPVPFNLSAMPTTRTNGDDEDGVRTGTIDSSQVDNAGTSEVISRKSSRKTTVTMVFSSKKSSEQFPTKLHRMLEEVDPSVAGWRPHGRAFLVKMKSEFINDVLPRYGFKQTKISSFHRQLNLYGFSRIVEGPDAGSYYHECFLRGMPTLIEGMVRVTVKGGGKRPKPSHVAMAHPNFYAMPPVDEEAKKHVSQAERLSDDKEPNFESSCQENMKMKGTTTIASQPDFRPISPIPLGDAVDSQDIETLTRNIEKVISTIWDDHDDTDFTEVWKHGREKNRTSPPSHPPFNANWTSRYYSPPPTLATSFQEVTPSPRPTRWIDTIEDQTTFHGQVLDPPINSEQHSTPSRNSLIDMDHFIEDCSDITDITEADAVRLDYWDSIEGTGVFPSFLSSPIIANQKHETTRTDSLRPPEDLPLNFHSIGNDDNGDGVDYLSAIENCKDKADFFKAVDEFVDSL